MGQKREGSIKPKFEANKERDFFSKKKCKFFDLFECLYLLGPLGLASDITACINCMDFDMQFLSQRSLCSQAIKPIGKALGNTSVEIPG
jgi:hypothetical protein